MASVDSYGPPLTIILVSGFANNTVFGPTIFL